MVATATDEITDQFINTTLDNTTSTTTTNHIQSKNYYKNKKKREQKKLKQQQQHNQADAPDPNNNESSLLLNHYFKQHCKSIELQYNQSIHSRSVMSLQSIAPGTQLYLIQSYVNIINDAHIHQLCHCCMNQPSSHTVFLTCTLCSYARYCSVQCQNKQSAIHQLECNTLKQLLYMKNNNIISGETAPLRGVIRYMYQKYQAQQTSVKKSSSSKYRHNNELKQIVSNDELGHSSTEADTLISNSMQLDSQLMIQTKLVLNKLCDVIDDNVWLGTDTAYNIYMKLRCNAHQITSRHDQLHIGFALYLPAAMQNHSCLPTCIYYITDKYKQLCMRTIRKVDSPGVELTYAYTNLYDKRAIRHYNLKQMYYIEECRCERCIVPLNESTDRYIEGYICNKCDISDINNNILYRLSDTVYQCKLCTTEYNIDEFISVEQICHTLFNNAIKLNTANHNIQALITTIENKVLSKLYSILHIYNVSIFNICVYLISLYVQLQQSHNALHHIQYCIDAMEYIELYNHPELGSMYEQLYHAYISYCNNKTTDNQRYKQSAVDAITHAVEIYIICFGHTHEITKAANKLLKQTK